MASMIISTYMSFLPQRTDMFCCIVLCIGFFGIFIPYQEHRKKQMQKSTSKQPEKPKRTEKTTDKKQLEQLETLKTAGIISEEEYKEKKRELQRQ